MCAALPAVTVSTIYCLYDACRREKRRRERLLRERVAYMLWVMASEDDADDRDGNDSRGQGRPAEPAP
jgi:hypothetical protein